MSTFIQYDGKIILLRVINCKLWISIIRCADLNNTDASFLEAIGANTLVQSSTYKAFWVHCWNPIAHILLSPLQLYSSTAWRQWAGLWRPLCRDTCLLDRGWPGGEDRTGTMPGRKGQERVFCNIFRVTICSTLNLQASVPFWQSPPYHLAKSLSALLSHRLAARRRPCIVDFVERRFLHSILRN